MDGDAAQDVDWVDVRDSDASPGATISALSSVDSGNNDNWSFASAGVTNTGIGTGNTEGGGGEKPGELEEGVFKFQRKAI